MIKKGTLLLTGGSGMVGRNILEHPLAVDWEILAPSSRDLDLTDFASVQKYLGTHSPDLVVHAAGKVGGIQANIAQPVSFLEANAAMGRNIIMAAYQSGVPRFLNLASTCVYPRAAANPLSEDMILTGELEPSNEGYALAKIMAIRLCQYIRRENQEFQYKTLIPCNLFGRHDTFDPKHSHLLPSIIHKMYIAKTEGQQTVEIWGDGTARREFMYAVDVADAILKAAADISAIPDLMNVGLGHDHSINDYYAAVARVVGWDGKFSHDLTKPTGMKQKLCSTKRLSNWGWSAPTSLDEGIAHTYNHYLERTIS